MLQRIATTLSVEHYLYVTADYSKLFFSLSTRTLSLINKLNDFLLIIMNKRVKLLMRSRSGDRHLNMLGNVTL